MLFEVPDAALCPQCYVNEQIEKKKSYAFNGTEANKLKLTRKVCFGFVPQIGYQLSVHLFL